MRADLKITNRTACCREKAGTLPPHPCSLRYSAGASSGAGAVDLQLNAFAGFRRGLPDLLRRRLTLSIGLPLVAGLSVRQFGGVLAHEFGHFSQGAAMSLTFLSERERRFARVVYERDAWDDRLRSGAQGNDFRFGIILHLARAMVWVTRRILWLLMNVGHAVSCFMMRQWNWMRTDLKAKWREAKLRRDDAGLSIAQRSLATDHRAPNRGLRDPSIGQRSATAERDGGKASCRKGGSSKLGCASNREDRWFDRTRVIMIAFRRAKRLAQLVCCTEMVMPRNCFGTLSNGAGVNEALLRGGVRDRSEGCDVHSFEEMSTETLAAAEEDELVEKWFGSLLNPYACICQAGAVSSGFGVLSAAPAAALAAAGPFVQVLLKADAEAVDAGNALHLLNAGFVVNPKDFGLKKGHARKPKRPNGRQVSGRSSADQAGGAGECYVRAVRRRRSRCTGERHYRARTNESSRGFDFAFPNIAIVAPAAQADFSA